MLKCRCSKLSRTQTCHDIFSCFSTFSEDNSHNVKTIHRAFVNHQRNRQLGPTILNVRGYSSNYFVTIYKISLKEFESGDTVCGGSFFVILQYDKFRQLILVSSILLAMTTEVSIPGSMNTKRGTTRKKKTYSRKVYDVRIALSSNNYEIKQLTFQRKKIVIE